MTLKIKKLNDLAIEPKLGSEEAAGIDLYAASSSDIWIEPSETVMIGTGLAIELEKGTFGGIFARSGLACKQGLRPANCVGVIDSDYRGELIVALHNDTKESQLVPAQSRIAQLVVLPYIRIEDIELTDELSDTERGEGGFGSTGIK
jgi:dUTP pyrophosphatase